MNGYKVLAKAIECFVSPDGFIVEGKGKIVTLDKSAKTFTLDSALFSGLTLSWNDTTRFADGRSADDLAVGTELEVNGVVSGSTVTVTRIEIEDGVSTPLPGVKIYETKGVASNVVLAGGKLESFTVNGLDFHGRHRAGGDRPEWRGGRRRDDAGRLQEDQRRQRGAAGEDRRLNVALSTATPPLTGASSFCAPARGRPRTSGENRGLPCLRGRSAALPMHPGIAYAALAYTLWGLFRSTSANSRTCPPPRCCAPHRVVARVVVVVLTWRPAVGLAARAAPPAEGAGRVRGERAAACRRTG